MFSTVARISREHGEGISARQAMASPACDPLTSFMPQDASLPTIQLAR